MYFLQLRCDSCLLSHQDTRDIVEWLSVSDAHLLWQCCALLSHCPSFAFLPVLPLSHPCLSAWLFLFSKPDSYCQLAFTLTIKATLIHCLCSFFISDTVSLYYFWKMCHYNFPVLYLPSHTHPSAISVSQYKVFFFAWDLCSLVPLFSIFLVMASFRFSLCWLFHCVLVTKRCGLWKLCCWCHSASEVS